MKQYQSHKVVEAAIYIATIAGQGSPEGGILELEVKDDMDSESYVIKVDAGIFSRNHPFAGDYIVKYNGDSDDEYYSWSPKAIFEAGNHAYFGDEPIPNKITKEHLISKIASVEFYRHEMTTLTICILTMENSCVVTGESACVDPGQFDQAKGEDAAYDNAFEKLWQLEGYLLLQKHHDVRYLSGGPKTAGELNT